MPLHRPGVRLLALLVAGSACAPTTLTHPVPDAKQQSMARQIGGRRATVTVVPPAPAMGAGAATGDTLVFSGKTYLEQGMVRVVQKQQDLRIPLADVRELDANRAGTSALIGTGVGVVGGVLLSFLAGASGGDCGEKDDRCLEGAEAAALSMIFFVPVGAVLGLVFGAAAGSGPSYRFTPAAQSSR